MFKRLLAGVVIGAAAGMLILPQLDRKTQRMIKKTGRRLCDVTGDARDSIMDYMH